MITKDNGLRYAKLIHVSVDNGLTAQSNKVYIMEELGDGKIKCDYGRVGKDMVTVYKSTSEWNKVYSSKVNPRKGYHDVTDMIAEPTVETTSGTGKKSTTADISCPTVKKLFDDLMAFANKSIQKNYKVSQEAVTQLQIDRAQEVLNKANKVIKLGMNVKEVNDLLIELYTIIPRKMNDVRDHLVSKANDKADIEWITNFLSNEQDTLDTMAGQVQLINQQKAALVSDDTDEVKDKKQVTILEQMGLVVEVETDKDALKLIDKLLGPNANQAKRILKCVNKKTQGVFDAHLSKCADKTRKLFWHGSRNENWFNIIQTGLMIRPSGAVHTGSMFGDGIYFANKAQKSIGYTSLRGSYWAGGSDNKGYLALFDVHTGNPKHIHRHDYSCSSLSQKVMEREGFDSVFAHGGADLRNDEFIVYQGKQCTIAYIVELG